VLDQLSGEGTTATQQTALEAGNMFNRLMLDQALSAFGSLRGGFAPGGAPLQYAPSERRERPAYKAFDGIRAPVAPPPAWRSWAAGFGGAQSLSGDPVIGSADASNRTIGMSGGADYRAGPDLLLGFAAAVTASSFSVPGRATTGTLDAGHVGLYGIQRWGEAYLAGTLSYGHFSNETTRSITGIGPPETAYGTFGSDQLGGRLQVGRAFAFGNGEVTPFAAVQYLQLWQEGYREISFAGGGPGSLGLTFQSRAVSSLPTFLGAEVSARLDTGFGLLVPFARAAWVHEFSPDRSVAAGLGGLLLTGSFIVDGPRAARDAARIEAGWNHYFARNLAVFGSFVGEYSGSTSSNAGNAGLRVTW